MRFPIILLFTIREIRGQNQYPDRDTNRRLYHFRALCPAGRETSHGTNHAEPCIDLCLECDVSIFMTKEESLIAHLPEAIDTGRRSGPSRADTQQPGCNERTTCYLCHLSEAREKVQIWQNSEKLSMSCGWKLIPACSMWLLQDSVQYSHVAVTPEKIAWMLSSENALGRARHLHSTYL